MRKYARIFVRGHYLFQDANSFPRKTESFEEQIMSWDKYTSIFSRKIEAFVLIVLLIFCIARETMHTNSLMFAAWYVLFWVCSGMSLMNKEIFTILCNNHKTLSYLELNFRGRLQYLSGREAWKIGNITWVIYRISPSFSRGIFGLVMHLDQSLVCKSIWRISTDNTTSFEQNWITS